MAWLAAAREGNAREPVVLERAPEICVEVLSPSNTAAEIEEKRALYFAAGAQDVWTCNLDGKLKFHVAPGQLVGASRLCPSFPQEVA
jgi:Uma2 family endonuclease